MTSSSNISTRKKGKNSSQKHQLTTHTLPPIEVVPSVKNLTSAAPKKPNSKSKRERDERFGEWSKKKRTELEKGHTLVAQFDPAFQETDDVEMSERSQELKEPINSSIPYNFRSRSPKNIPPTSSPSTPRDADPLNSATTDVDSLTISERIKHRRSASSTASRIRTIDANDPPMVCLASFLDPSSQPTEKRNIQRGEIDPNDLHISETVLGEGQLGVVRLGCYKGLPVACKSKRQYTRSYLFSNQAKREMMFAAKLSACRYINRYIGWVSCHRHHVEGKKPYDYGKDKQFLYIVQRYVPNGDARGYLEKRASSFKPLEVLQASICLFAALTDAHALNIGIVDLKLENFLIDSSGAGWLTDFGSCIEFTQGVETVNLDEEDVAWTDHVAPPEMFKKHTFSKASDVFMATLIIAELMTADISDADFQTRILQRDSSTGEVSISTNLIDPTFEVFFTLLKLGLSNNPYSRPTAGAILDYLLAMKQ
ncbi:kinase-like domain-containing protein [Parasitella parasitica]|nr:kinase-like domain-containing protein [Parasitella parasitica]